MTIAVSLAVSNTGLDFLDSLEVSGSYSSDCNGHWILRASIETGGTPSKLPIIPGIIELPLPQKLSLVVEKAPQGWGGDARNPAMNSFMVGRCAGQHHSSVRLILRALKASGFIKHSKVPSLF